MQFWRHILRRVPKPDNSYGGKGKKRAILVADEFYASVMQASA